MAPTVPRSPRTPFTLAEPFIDGYRTRRAPFGFNALGELVYLRTYSRLKADGTNERWFETVRRVVEGTYRMQQRHILANHLPWNERKAQRSAEEMYERMFTMKFLPPGRGLWAMGSALTEERGLYAALNNCAFVSTKDLAEDLADPFTFLMDASMLGIGVGFDTKGAGTLTIQNPYDGFDASGALPLRVIQIADTREGWVESLQAILLAYFVPREAPVAFDYSLIRPAGVPIKGFGGTAAGPEPLQTLHQAVRTVLEPLAGHPITVTAIVDIMNLIGKCVVAGNVRRTAEIAFGRHDDLEFIDLKNPEVNPARNHPKTGWGWTSNNSIFAELGMGYGAIGERIKRNGEPGVAWLENMRDFSRMQEGERDGKDHRAEGGNPCLEQTLESYELCCLVETFPRNHDSLDDYLRTLKFAYLYAKTVTLGATPWPRTNAVMLRNRRIGLSQSGIQQAVVVLGLNEFRDWCHAGYQEVQYYDAVYSDWFAIPRSIKTTSIKPSGSVSLLAGATPGMHWPEFKQYIRRMRLGKHSDLVQPLKDAGYVVEDCWGDDSSVVVEVPVQIEEEIRTVHEVSMWEQLAMAAFLQRHWADNQVSCTVSFDPATEGDQIAAALDYYQFQLKGISFLPRFREEWVSLTPLEQTTAERILGITMRVKQPFPQMPYEAITEAMYQLRASEVSPVVFANTHEKAEAEKFCSNDTCTI